MKACCVDKPGGIPVEAKPRRFSRRAKRVCVGGLAALLVASVALMIIEKQAQQRSRVVNEMVSFGLALLMFDQVFGGYPSDETADAVREGTGTDLPLTGKHVLNQLKAYGGLGSLSVMEEIGRADGGWVYFPGFNQCSNPVHPLLVSPSVGGERFVLRVDNGVGVLADGELDHLPEHISPPVSFPDGSANQ